MNYCPICATALINTYIDAVERIACPSTDCDFVHWDNPTPVVAAIVEHEGDIILVRNVGWPEKIFGLITGFLEKGETPIESILREVKEELGLSGEIAEYIGNYVYFDLNQLLIVYHVIASGEIQLGNELVAHKRIPPERLRPWPFGTGLAVRDWLEARKVQADGE